MIARGHKRKRRGLLGRLRAAWSVLLRGATAPAEVEVARAEAQELVECALALVGLPFRWAAEATSEELAVLERAAAVARRVRDTEWAEVEAFAAERHHLHEWTGGK
jgi:hypothetical protein